MATKSKVIAVTGASRGIGASIASELAHRGFTVACLTRKGAGPETQAAKSFAANFVNVACDVTDEASLKTAFATVAQKAGGLHGLVNNAGIHLDGASHELATATYETVMTTNATAVFAACREAYPYLVKSGGGTIVNIGSFFDKIGVKRNVAYCASKAAVGAITRCLAVEWAKDRINVIDVAPGYVATDFNAKQMAGPLGAYLAKRVPTGGPGSAEEVARFIALLFEQPLPNLTGETIYLDGGQGIAH